MVSGGPQHATFISGAQGLQLEIWATFSCAPGAIAEAPGGGKFGLLVLAAATRSEYTAIVFDSARQHFLLDRTHSGLNSDADIRGGPWPMGDEAAAAEESSDRVSVSVHAYVDHAVVEMIANSTANASTTPIAAWGEQHQQSVLDLLHFDLYCCLR